MKIIMKQIHLIANAHLDPVWLWQWEEGCAEALSTFRTACDLLDEFPDFIFNHNEALLYDWVKEHDPELFGRIQRFVEKGRWHIIGDWYLQPDCNMPAGESFVRNIVLGRKFFAENFVREKAKTAINFDSFGHSRGLVQILTQAGYDSYLVCRPAKDNFDFPNQDYLWKGFAGSEIVVHRSDENYNSVWGRVAEDMTAFLEEKKDETVTLFLWGVGDHGGGPSRKDLGDVTVLMAEERDDYKILHSTPEQYFAELREKKQELPLVERGLNPVAVGCYTSQVRVKQKHCQLENWLYSGEKMSAAAELLCGRPYPSSVFEEAAKDLLFSEFHDALPGSGIQPVEEDTLRVLDHGLEILSRERMGSFLALTAGEPAVKENTTPILFYNPHPFDLEGVFVCDAGLPKQNWSTDFLYPVVTRDGQPIPCQAEKEVSNFSLDWRKRVAIQATLPAGSMSRFDVAFKPIPEGRPTFASITDRPVYLFDNGIMQVEVNTGTGLIDSYRVDGVEYLGKDSCRLVCRDDTNSPWGMGTMTTGTRTFQLLFPHQGSEFSGIDDRVIPSVRVIEDGEVRTVVEAVFGLSNSRAWLRYLLPKEGGSFDIEAGIYFGEKQQSLKLWFQTALPADSVFLGQVPFGRDVLAKEGAETVSQKWLALTGGDKAFAIINSGTYGASCESGAVGCTLLRSAGYSASDFVMGKAYSEDRFAPRMEQGERLFRFRIAAGGHTLLDDIDNRALAFNEEPFALAYCPSGEGEKKAPFYSIDNPAVVLSALKRGEDGDGYILRLYQTTSQLQKACVTIPSLSINTAVTLAAGEIKTFRAVPGLLEECSLTEGY